MNQLSDSAQEMLAAFSTCRGWEQRARLLLQHGQQLPVLPATARTDDNLIRGCESPVWCVVNWPEGWLELQLDTDARLLKGLLAVLRTRLEGLSAEQLRAVDLPDWFARLGLAGKISTSRGNGLNAVYQHILEQADSFNCGNLL